MLAHPRNLATCPAGMDFRLRGGEFSACLRSFPFRKELGRPRMVVPTGAVVCGRADRAFRFESLNRRVTDDPPYQACSVQSASA